MGILSPPHPKGHVALYSSPGELRYVCHLQADVGDPLINACPVHSQDPALCETVRQMYDVVRQMYDMVRK
jgi:hypothetical protein